ncbi:unnamed protein product [Adineta ricciae]|uniref:Uncharacterized protein n=1 Tax=Adineta ricciae TaxID=249248 RepID=A0A814NLS5_ADIRI|nr:unnamed protein product [Adineta ricciae]CAF1224672.1 unnamed protein product [Adineta ricciae]
MHLVSIVLFGLVLFDLQQQIDAISCYVCGRGSEGCGTSFRSWGSGVATSAVTNAVACTKIVSTVNSNSILRSYVGKTGTCTEGANNDDGTNSYQYCCTTDYCNKGSIGKGNILSGIFSISLAMFFVFMN